MTAIKVAALLVLPAAACFCQDGCTRDEGYELCTSHSLSGFVAYTNTAEPTPGVSIQLWSKGWERLLDSTTTDDGGFFSLGDHPEGAYDLIADRKCWIHQKMIVNVSRKSKEELDFISDAEGDCSASQEGAAVRTAGRSITGWECANRTDLARNRSGELVWLEPGDLNRRITRRESPGAPSVVHSDQPEIRSDVSLDLVIGPDGAVCCMRVNAGDPLAVAPVIMAVRSWQFKPFTSHGRSSPVLAHVVVPYAYKPSH